MSFNSVDEFRFPTPIQFPSEGGRGVEEGGGKEVVTSGFAFEIEDASHLKQIFFVYACARSKLSQYRCSSGFVLSGSSTACEFRV